MKTEAEWQKELDDHRYKVLRTGATEAPGSGKLLDNKQAGDYVCGACEAKLFNSDHKFESSSGWPSFYDLENSKAVNLVADFSHGMERLEVRCATCDSHLGHLFDDGADNPTGKRYCINSAALDFMGQDGKKVEG